MDKIIALIASSGYMGAVVWRMVEVLRPALNMKTLHAAVIVLSIGLVKASHADLLKDAGLDFGVLAVYANALLVAGAAVGINDVANVVKRMGDKK